MVQVTTSSLCADMHSINTLYDLIGNFSKKLMVKGYMFGSAESCTGGLLAACCTDVAGSSDWYKGSIVSYSNAVKQKNLGVSSHILQTYGAVSKETVEAMAKGAIEGLDIQVAVAISGVAGPAGGTQEKPVGTVWIAAVVHGTKREHLVSEKFVFVGTRADIRLAAVKHALLLAIQVCEEE